MTNQNPNNAAQAANKEIREAFELTYAADADDPASATELSHFTNGWRACVMSQVRAPVADERGLLPCPFCGSEAFETFKTDDDGIRRHSVHCKAPNCGGQTRDRHFSEAEAIAAWNCRAALASAPVGDERAAQEYGSPADVAQRIEQYLAQDGRMNSGTQLLYEAMKALRASQGDRNDG